MSVFSGPSPSEGLWTLNSVGGHPNRHLRVDNTRAVQLYGMIIYIHSIIMIILYDILVYTILLYIILYYTISYSIILHDI